MRRFMSVLLVAAIVVAFAVQIADAKPQYVKPLPLDQRIKVSVGDVKQSSCMKLFAITWGADIATHYANGGMKTAKGSIFDNEGLCFELIRQDNYRLQFEAYLKGETPYLRMPLDSLLGAIELLSKNPKTVPVVIEQRSWSAGGDVSVSKDSVKTLCDLRKKVVVIQIDGPHLGFLARVLKDCGMTLQDIELRFVEDLVGVEGNTPGAALREDTTVDEVIVISPDAALLMTPAKGPESFYVPGSHSPLSTRTLDHILPDVYIVRADYLQQNRDKVEKFVHGLLVSEEQVRALFQNTGSPAYAHMLKGAVELFGGDLAAKEVEGLYSDGKTVGYRGNVSFFTNPNDPRNLSVVSTEIQKALVSVGLISKVTPVEHAKWDYAKLAKGLTDTAGVEAPRFDAKALTKIVNQKQQRGTLEEGQLFSFEVLFGIEEKTFNIWQYKKVLLEMAERSSTYGGAGVSIEAYADPTNYVELKQKGASSDYLKKVRQAAKGLSYARAVALRKVLLEVAEAEGLILDPTQFVVAGHGIEKPKTGMCGADPCMPANDDARQSNRRAEFRFLQIEAESSAFAGK